MLRTTTSHEEGCERRWSILTRKLEGVDGRVTHYHGCEVEWVETPEGMKMQERSGAEFTLEVDLVVLAMGFVHVVHEGIVEHLGLQRDGRGNIIVDDTQMTSWPGAFAAGDASEGASLVVHAIASGRSVAESIDRYLREKG